MPTFKIETVNYRVDVTDLTPWGTNPEHAYGWELYYQDGDNRWVCYAAGCATDPEACQTKAEAKAQRHHRVYHETRTETRP